VLADELRGCRFSRQFAVMFNQLFERLHLSQKQYCHRLMLCPQRRALVLALCGRLLLLLLLTC